MYSKNFSTKRLNNDIKEIYNNPIEGIGIISLDNDIMKYVVNIMLLSGPYKSYCLQLLLTFPDNYPIYPPKVLIYPNQLFDNLYHRHIFSDDKKDENGNIFKKLCFDLLDNDFLSTKNEKTGWNPSYTISTLLMQVQSFLSDPDLSENSMPNPHQIKELMDSMNDYQRIFKIHDENGEIIKIHTWKDPYPKMFFKVNEISNQTEDLISYDKNKIIKENLTCYIMKLNIFDDPYILLGYPIVKKSSNIIYPIPEILSYEGYLTQTSYDYQDYFYFFRYDRKTLKSANNEFYDSWLPIYINETNFEYNKQAILNSFSVLKYGDSGKEEYDFKPKYIFEIIFNLLNQMIINMKENKISNAYLRAFFQYILLYNKLSKLYPDDMKEYFNADLLLDNNYDTSICDFIIFTLFDKISLIENKLFKLKEIKKSKKAFELFQKIEDYDLLSPHVFLQDLMDNHIYSKIAKIMKYEKNLFLYNGKNIDRKIKQIICTSFKKFINNSDTNTREKLKKIIVENINFYEHIEFGKFFYQKSNYKSNEKIDDILGKLIILLYIKKKINEKNFMNELENNFSICLDIDETIKKLNEITNNIEIYFDEEIGDLDEESNTIIQIVKESLILDYKNIEKEKIEKIEKELKDLKKQLVNLIKITIQKPNNSFIYSINLLNKIDSFKFIEKPDLFDKIIAMKIDNLRLLFSYCYERLEKSINRKNTNLSFIEMKFLEISLNNNADKNCEWYDIICSKQKYYKENKEDIDYNQLVTNNRYLLIYFNRLVTINKELLLFENFEITSGYFFFFPLIIRSIMIKIEEFANFLLGKKTYFDKFSYSSLSLNENDASIKKLKEIYDTQDITLLTFYELLLLEKDKKIEFGFLSIFKTQFLYDLQMKDTIKKLKESQKQKINRINKKEKRFKKQLNNNILKFNTKKKNTFGLKKFSLWKTPTPIKIKKSNHYNNNYHKNKY